MSLNNDEIMSGVTQRTMSLIADVAPSTINRAISSAGYTPIPSTTKGKLRYAVKMFVEY